MKKIILIYTNARIRKQKPRPPVGLLYLAASLRQKYETIIIDMRVNKDYLNILKRNLPDCIFVGISTIIGQQLMFSLSAAELIKKLRPDVPIVFGGTFPTMAPKVVLREKCIDYISLGDGEDTLLQLADALSEHRDVSSIPGLVYREGDNIVIHEHLSLRSLDTPVLPAWELLNVSDYREANVLSSKGCSGGCSFCYNRIFNRSCQRLRPAKNVIDEILFLHREKNVNHIAFVDDNFFGNLEHATEIMRLIAESKTNITWETTCRADDFSKFDDSTMELIRDSGCKELFIGFESASDHVLKQVNKQIESNLMDICMKKAQKYGIIIRALFVIGLPGETKKELLLTLRTVDYLYKSYRSDVKIPVFGIYTPYPQMPPSQKEILSKYKEPQTMEEWSLYHHDRANHQWLTKRQRGYLETVIWVYRYYSKRSKFTNTAKNKLLYIDALLRWKLKFFSFAPEWRVIINEENGNYINALEEVKAEYEMAVKKYFE